MLFPSLRTLIKCMPLTISKDLNYTKLSLKRSIILVLVDFFLENRYTKVERQEKEN